MKPTKKPSLYFYFLRSFRPCFARRMRCTVALLCGSSSSSFLFYRRSPNPSTSRFEGLSLARSSKTISSAIILQRNGIPVTTEVLRRPPVPWCNVLLITPRAYRWRRKEKTNRKKGTNALERQQALRTFPYGV